MSYFPECRNLVILNFNAFALSSEETINASQSLIELIYAKRTVVSTLVPDLSFENFPRRLASQKCDCLAVKYIRSNQGI